MAIALARYLIIRLQFLINKVQRGISPLIYRALYVILLLVGVVIVYNLIYSAIIGSAFSNYVFDSNLFLYLPYNSDVIYTQAGIVGSSVKIINVSKHKISKEGLVFTAINRELLEVQEALKPLFLAFTNRKKFKALGDFKVVRINAINHEGLERCIHPTVLISSDTTFQDYFCKVKDKFCYYDDYGPHDSYYIFIIYRVTVISVDKYVKNKISLNSTGTHTEVTSIESIDDTSSIDKISTNSNTVAGGLIKSDINSPLKGNGSNRNFSTSVLRLVAKSSKIKGSKESLNAYTKLSRRDNNSQPFAKVDVKIIKAPNFNIKPLVRKDKTIKPIATMDLETMEFQGLQYPVAISVAHLKTGYKYKVRSPKIISKLFLIDLPVASSDLLTVAEPEMLRAAVQHMFNQYLDYCKENRLEHFMVHNLGSFDGLFLFKALFDYFPPAKIKPLMDPDHRFINILAEYPDGVKIEWKDSYRIFPVSLNDLCSNFGVEGKAGDYLPEFNSFDLLLGSKSPAKGCPTAKQQLLNKFKRYSLADSEALLRALLVAQQHYFNEFQVDIMSIYSTASLAMKVFRQKFFPNHVQEIPILKGNVDVFVRQAYLEGAVDVYKRYAENVYYYNVNDLYLFAQLKPLPFNCIGYKKKLDSLDNFFGFVEVEVTAPMLPKPMLPLSRKGKIFFPTGTWKGIYFSEELKAVEKLGYKFKLGQAYEFSKEVLFKDYIDHFYNIKRTSTGPQRFIANIMLNNLYKIGFDTLIDTPYYWT